MKRKRTSSPYLLSSIVFALSSVVSTGMAIQSCVVDGWSSTNIGNLASNMLYLVAYMLYVRAETTPSLPTAQQGDVMPLLSSPMIQRR